MFASHEYSPLETLLGIFVRPAAILSAILQNLQAGARVPFKSVDRLLSFNTCSLNIGRAPDGDESDTLAFPFLLFSFLFSFFFF